MHIAAKGDAVLLEIFPPLYENMEDVGRLLYGTLKPNVYLYLHPEADGVERPPSKYRPAVCASGSSTFHELGLSATITILGKVVK